MKTAYKALLLDLDGTTVASRQNAMPSRRVVNTVRAAQEKIHVGVATGRSYEYALAVVQALGLKGPSVFNGGAEIIEADTGKVISRKLLSSDAIREAVVLALPFGYAIYTDENYYNDPDQVSGDAAKLLIGEVKTKDAVHMLEALGAVEKASAHPTSSWAKGDVVDIHITHADGTKRHGVERLLDILGVDSEDVLAIGDSHNDIPMLEAAGFKVVMGGAPTEVKAVADHIAPSLKHDGVADTIERFILKAA